MVESRRAFARDFDRRTHPEHQEPAMCRNIKTFFNTAGYLKDGRMTSKEDIVVGIDTFP